MTALMVAARLYLDKKINKLLICCPLSVFGSWQNDTAMVNIPCNVQRIGGTETQRNKTLQALNIKDKLQIGLINYELAWRMEKQLLAAGFDMVICDESQRIKTPTANQSKFFHKLGQRTKYKLILTGTPVTKTPLDYWSQFKFLDDSKIPFSYYAARSKYAIMGGFENRQVIGYRSEIKQYLEDIHSIAYRVRAEDCLDLPEQTDIYREVELESDAKKLYNQLAKQCYAELENKTITTAQVIVKALRLSQITGGFVGIDIEPSGDGKAERMVERVSKAKLKELEAICEDLFDTGKKVVIFARFRAEITAICELLAKLKVNFVMVNGDTPSQQRTEYINEFQTNSECMAFVSNAQCAGLGVTLTAGSYTVFYSYSYNYADYEQARKRTHRIGQEHKCTYIHLEVKNSIDSEILAALKDKRSISEFSVDEAARLFKRIGE